MLVNHIEDYYSDLCIYSIKLIDFLESETINELELDVLNLELCNILNYINNFYKFASRYLIDYTIFIVKKDKSTFYYRDKKQLCKQHDIKEYKLEDLLFTNKDKTINISKVKLKQYLNDRARNYYSRIG